MIWQPIETAPKDGTRILLWGVGDEGPNVGSWAESVYLNNSHGWIIYYARSDTIQLNPSHWVPLPEPPK